MMPKGCLKCHRSYENETGNSLIYDITRFCANTVLLNINMPDHAKRIKCLLRQTYEGGNNKTQNLLQFYMKIVTYMDSMREWDVSFNHVLVKKTFKNHLRQLHSEWLLAGDNVHS
jgi:hypothetical protein